jgi:hypothetical protein
MRKQILSDAIVLRGRYPLVCPLNLLYFRGSACAKYGKYIMQTDHAYDPIKNVVKTAEIKEKARHCK